MSSKKKASQPELTQRICVILEPGEQPEVIIGKTQKAKEPSALSICGALLTVIGVIFLIAAMGFSIGKDVQKRRTPPALSWNENMDSELKHWLFDSTPCFPVFHGETIACGLGMVTNLTTWRGFLEKYHPEKNEKRSDIGGPTITIQRTPWMPKFPDATTYIQTGSTQTLRITAPPGMVLTPQENVVNSITAPHIHISDTMLTQHCYGPNCHPCSDPCHSPVE